MQSIDTYAENAFLRVLTQGPPGSGKSTLACNFPDVYFIDIDVNLAGPIKFQREKNRNLPVGYDRLDVDDKGVEIPLAFRYDRLNSLIVAASTEPRIKTVVLDSATGLSDVIMAHTVRLNPTVKDGRQIFGLFLQNSKIFFSKMTTIQKHLIVTCHERLERDPIDESVKYKVVWPGQLGDYLGWFFTDVWHTEVQSISGVPPTYKYLIRTMPDHRFDLKNSRGLPPVFEFNWDTIAKTLV